MFPAFSFTAVLPPLSEEKISNVSFHHPRARIAAVRLPTTLSIYATIATYCRRQARTDELAPGHTWGMSSPQNASSSSTHRNLLYQSSGTCSGQWATWLSYCRYNGPVDGSCAATTDNSRSEKSSSM